MSGVLAKTGPSHQRARQCLPHLRQCYPNTTQQDPPTSSPTATVTPHRSRTPSATLIQTTGRSLRNTGPLSTTSLSQRPSRRASSVRSITTTTTTTITSTSSKEPGLDPSGPFQHRRRSTLVSSRRISVAFAGKRTPGPALSKRTSGHIPARSRTSAAPAVSPSPKRRI